MRFWLALACSLRHALAEAPTRDEGVYVLGKDNFADFVKENDRVLVEFYAPWCGHCKSLAPEYAKAAQTLESKGSKTALAKVDATVESQLAKDYDVSGYPTLFYFNKGSHAKYEGPRDEKGIVGWCEKREYPPVRVLKRDDVQGYTGSSGSYKILGEVKKGSARAKALSAAAEQYVDSDAWSFAAVHLGKDKDPKKDATLKLIRTEFGLPDEKELVYGGQWTENNIVRWLRASTYPTVADKFTAKMYVPGEVAKFGFKGAVVVSVKDAEDDEVDKEIGDLDDDDEEDAASKKKDKPAEDAPKVDHRAEAVKAAQASKSYAFAMSVLGSDQDLLGTTAGQAEPQVTVLLEAGGKPVKYVARGASHTTAEGIAKFLKEVESGAVKRYLKSEAPPKTPTLAGVTTLVGSTFEQVALDSGKDVFVEFYAPWCGHCKKLEPEWSKLGDEVDKRGWGKKGVVVAKMDNTGNECEQEVSGFPTLVLYPATGKKAKKIRNGVKYDGAREYKAMLEFLAENAATLEDLSDEEKLGLADKGGKKSFNMAQRDLEKKKKEKKGEL